MSRQAIDPSGHVVSYEPAVLKPGWRWADEVPPPAPAVEAPAPVDEPAPPPKMSNRARRRAEKAAESVTDDSWSAPTDSKDPTP